MLFNSYSFFVLLAITFILYYLPKTSRYQVETLILSSLVFYSYNQPILVLLLIFSVLINIVSSYYVVYGNSKYRKHYAVAGVAVNLSVLLFFKYSKLLAASFFQNNASVGEFLLNIPLPIGISFFTFQGISLVVDVYKEKYFKGAEVVPVSIITHAKRIFFFKAFFPQLISGPIVKAHDFLPQISRKYFADIDWESCFRSLIIGYFLKMVVADNLKNFTFWIQFPFFQNYSSITLVTMLFGYSCQIFADFAGYSLIAIGLARLFGYKFPINFNFPYIATSFKDFWKRWHISLSTFLMEYLYIPLGGNKKGKARTYINLMVTMLLGGLWHGAAWSYMVWGGFHGAALAIERAIGDKVKVKPNAIVNFLKGAMVFLFVTLAWLLFKLPDFSHVIEYFRCIGKNGGYDDAQIISYILLYSLPVVLYHIAYLLLKNRNVALFNRYEHLAYAVMLFLLIFNSGTPGAFIYFQF